MCERKEVKRKQKANRQEDDLRSGNETKMDVKKYRKTRKRMGV